MLQGRCLLRSVAATVLMATMCGCAIPGKNESNWAETAPSSLRERLRSWTQQYAQGGSEGARLGLELYDFYLRRGDRLAWNGPWGPLVQADGLLEALRGLTIDGLKPEDYGVNALAATIDSLRNPAGKGRPIVRRQADLDIALTAAFLRSARHLLAGRVAIKKADANWQVLTQVGNLAGLLEMALSTNQVRQTLLGLRPRRVEYRRLQGARLELLELASRGGWPQIPSTTLSGRLDRKLTALLHRRLLLSGDAEDSGDLKLALSRFQRRHGLSVSGRLDSASVATLNVSVQQRIAQLELNLERWRWLPHTLGSQYILVRIADFELDVVESDKIDLSMRVIVGKPDTRTPVFSSEMTHLVFNPYWRIPPSISTEEVLPKLAKDPGYLERHQIHILPPVAATSAISGGELDLRAIQMGTSMLVQSPGGTNPLGRVKFAFPNPYNIYLHDTPAGELFGRNMRDFSHGCIRLERSLDLAVYLLRDRPEWSRARIEQVLDSGENVQAYFSRSVPIYLLYWTAWVDEEGKTQFRKDIYDTDTKVNRALLQAGVSVSQL